MLYFQIISIRCFNIQDNLNKEYNKLSLVCLITVVFLSYLKYAPTNFSSAYVDVQLNMWVLFETTEEQKQRFNQNIVVAQYSQWKEQGYVRYLLVNSQRMNTIMK